MATLEEFPHGGEHLENDDAQAKITLWLLGIFALATAILITMTFAR